ncbi:TonB-dependent receptor [Erythrobacter litoralis]|uniref:TonB-dependent receptor n=1 Tax=Erythrobacter litoralis TaxID=39960 RepID=UPI0024351072|nr:TonB-dependent receptor [Erythrobacter litoralis]
MLGAVPLQAQDLEGLEIVVTATRIDQDDYSDTMPAIGLRKPADFLVQSVAIRGDTRDPAQRRREIRTMLTDAIRRAESIGVELAYGDFILTPLTVVNAEEVSLQNDSRPDSERVIFLVKAPLGGRQSGDAAQAQIERFIEAVPEVGRAQMDEWGDNTLSIVGPDEYRPEIAAMIAQDANAMAGRMGESYKVEVTGLNMPVQWARSGPAEVFLYIPYELKIVPAP